MLPRRHRLNRPDQFRAVGRFGARSGGRHVVVQIHPSRESISDSEAPLPPLPQPALSRVGFVVGRSVGSAVVRNRVSRRLRAHLGRRLCDLPGGLDIVVRALPSSADAPFGDLVADTDRCLDKALAKVGQGAGTVRRPVP